jgi:hypothetical protein
VGADHDAPLRVAPRRHAYHVAQPAGHALVPPARQRAADLRGETPRRRRSRRPRPERDLPFEPGPRAVLVEAVDLPLCSGLRIARI